MSFSFDEHCSNCNATRRFALESEDITAEGQLFMHGNCVVCGQKATRNMGDSITIRAMCPTCKVEIQIMTFDGDPTNPLVGCSECGFSGTLDVLQIVRPDKLRTS
ncbi:MAG: hypothetical protein ACRD5H_10190 [Nitrososphaerales archaeon]